MMGHKRTTKKSNFATTAFVLREHLGFRGRARISQSNPARGSWHCSASRRVLFVGTDHALKNERLCVDVTTMAPPVKQKQMSQ